MSRTVKGYAANPLIVGGVCIVVGAAIGAAGMYAFMSQMQGGLGDGKELAPFEERTMTEAATEAATEETVLDTTEEETAPFTIAPLLEDVETVTITVRGKRYLYGGAAYKLEELRGIVRNAKDVTVTVRDERASLKAYDKLIDMLEDEDITFVEEN